MCGIFCCFCNEKNKICNPENSLLNVFEAFRNNLQNRGPDSSEVKTNRCAEHVSLFASTVLWLQGPNVVPQPLESDESICMYNGDIFGATTISEEKIKNDGDTVHVWKGLEININTADFLTTLEGPYAFIYLNKRKKELCFAGDPYGRRSLLIGKSDTATVICSVAKRTHEFKFIEVPPVGIFYYDLKTHRFKLFPWKRKDQYFYLKVKEVEDFLGTDIEVLDGMKEKQYRIFRPPTDCETKRMMDLTALNGITIFEKLLCDPSWLGNVTNFEKLLEVAIKKRIGTQPQFCNDCISNKISCNHALTGVLFSGGVDCAILALLADKYTDNQRPIDLINVAFDRACNYKTPDRVTGLQTLGELKKLRPERKWNFVEVNVTEKELNEKRAEHIADLIYPLNSVLDDSLGCALWFASRALTDDYKSPCRVLLVGMGADELFGGYTKHRNMLKRNGWQGLYDGLEDDWQNLPHRNLARDDRVVSDHSRQLRTPYLDERVVEFVRNLHVWERTCPLEDVPPGVGEKLLLRSVAYHLGLKEAALLKKRALQFGSRIANSKENARDVSQRLL